MKEKNLKRRNVLFKEGDLAEGLYLIKEGEFEHSIKHKTIEKDASNSNSNRILKINKVQELKLAIIG